GADARQIVRVDGVGLAPVFQFFDRPAEVIEHMPVDVLDLTPGRQDGDKAGDGIDDEPKMPFVHGEAVLHARALSALSAGLVGSLSHLPPICRPCPSAKNSLSRGTHSSWHRRLSLGNTSGGCGGRRRSETPISPNAKARTRDPERQGKNRGSARSALAG